MSKEERGGELLYLHSGERRNYGTLARRREEDKHYICAEERGGEITLNLRVGERRNSG